MMHININNLNISPNEVGKSSAIVKGVLQGFKNRGYNIGAFSCYATSNIFKGAGISSSAAYELLICEILNYYYNDDKIDRVEMAKIAQFSEVEYFGKPCGLLDQMGISLGGINMIDFKSTVNPLIKHVELELNDYDVILVNTGDDHTSLTKYYAEIKEGITRVAMTNAPRAIRYQPNSLKSCFFTKSIKNLIATKETANATTAPMRR